MSASSGVTLAGGDLLGSTTSTPSQTKTSSKLPQQLKVKLYAPSENGSEDVLIFKFPPQCYNIGYSFSHISKRSVLDKQKDITEVIYPPFSDPISDLNPVAGLEGQKVDPIYTWPYSVYKVEAPLFLQEWGPKGYVFSPFGLKLGYGLYTLVSS